MDQGRVTAAVTPDHIRPLALGGTDTNDNIRCLCQPCHTKRTAEQFDRKIKQEIGPDGWPL
jgi:5-methylcytosine-specific restriction protein A